MFENFEAGIKIFRGWRKRVGETDCDAWIGLTLITGIDRHHPAHYRTVVSINKDYLTGKVKFKGRLMMCFCVQDMEPENSENLDRFLYYYKKASCYRLQPGPLASIQSMLSCASELSIGKRQLHIVPAWQIGLNDPLCAALSGIDDPIIPPNVSDPPILKALKRFSVQNKQEAP